MKNVIFTYDTIQNGESGEACASILMDDDRAAEIKAAFASKSPDVYLLRERANGFCWGCEHLRGRKYVDNSIKSVENKEV